MVTIDTTHDDALREVPFARETIYDGHILHVEKWRVTCPNGREAPREMRIGRCVRISPEARAAWRRERETA